MNRFLSLLCMLAFCLPAAGQDEKAGPEVKFRVTRFDPADRPPPEFTVGPPGLQIEVKVPLTYIAGPFKTRLREGGFLDFWRAGEEKPELSLTITEAERKDLLLFFIPMKESFKVMKVRTPLTSIRGGDRYLVNATKSQLAIKLGDQKPVLIDPGKAGLLRGPGGADVVSLPVLISMKEDEKWKLVSTENWHCDPRFRKYLFAYISPRTRHLAFHGVEERLSTPE
jgi:hypothetical protein